jgi:protein transport protein SEC31
MPHSSDPFEAAMRSAVPQTPSFALKQPPKWLRRPVGASFGFGGKLVRFNNKAGQAAAQLAATLPPGTVSAPQSIPHHVTVTNVVTEPEIVKQADELETAMDHRTLQQLIDERQIQSSKTHNADEQGSWGVLRALYDEDMRGQLLAYLGFNKDDIVDTANKLTADKITVPAPSSSLVNAEVTSPSVLDSGNDGNRKGVSDLFGSLGSNDLFANQQMSATETTPNTAFSPLVNQQPFELYPSSSSSVDRLVTRAIVLGDFESAVNVCVASEKWSDALMLAICGGQELLDRTRQVYLQHHSTSQPYLRLLEIVVNCDLESVVRYTDLKEWSSVIAVLCTFAEENDFKSLCEILGARLEDAWTVAKDVNMGREYRRQATLCYLASANLEKVTGIWIVEQEEQEQAEDENSCGASLQHFVEKVTIFRNATGFVDAHLTDTTSTHYPLNHLYQKYCQYADLLATQGKLATALKYLNLTPPNYQTTSSADTLSITRDRVYRACGPRHGVITYPEPTFPFDLKPLVSELDLINSAAAASTQSMTNQKQYGAMNNTGYQPSYAPSQPTTFAAQQQQQQQQPTSYAPVTNPSNGMFQQQQQPPMSNPYGNTQQGPYGGGAYNQQGYSQPSAAQNNYSYGGNYSNTYQATQPPVSAPLPPPPMAGPPRQSSTISSPSRTGTPVNAKSVAGWNDPPMLANPNVTKSPHVPVSATGAPHRVTSPFPNMPAPNTFAPPPQQQYMQSASPQSNMGMAPPPPQQNAPPLPPPPMNATAPVPMAKQFQPPPPPQQHSLYNPSLQQQQPHQPSPTPPPPMNAYPSPSTAGPLRSPQPPQGAYAPLAPGPQQQQHSRPPPPPQFQQQYPAQPPQPPLQQQQQPSQPPFGQAPPPRQGSVSQQPLRQPHSPAPAASPQPSTPAAPEKMRHRKYEEDPYRMQQN